MNRAAGALAGVAVCLLLAPAASATFAGRNGLLVHAAPDRLWTERPNGSYRRELLKVDGAYDPRWSPDGRLVAFTAPTRSGNRHYDLFAIRADGSGLRRITRTPANESGAVWAPDGRRVAFSRGRRLWVVGVDGSHPHPLAARGYRGPFDWSPSGLIAYGGVDALYVLDPGGGAPRRVLDEPRDEQYAYDLDWGPNGRWIALTESLGGPCDFCTRITKVRVDGAGYMRFGGYAADGSLHTIWSPDGRSIRFCHLYDNPNYYPAFATFSIRPDGTHRRAVRRAECSGDWQALP